MLSWRILWSSTGMILWGIGMGAQESIMRAAVALLVPKGKKRGWIWCI
jgi:hypothetical protein